jgi:hypothetical protein
MTTTNELLFFFLEDLGRHELKQILKHMDADPDWKERDYLDYERLLAVHDNHTN